MSSKRLMVALGLVMVFSMALTACQPVVQTVEVIKTQEVVSTQLVEQTQIVEVAKKSFTTPHPILSDLRVRQAIAYCTNKQEIIQAVYPLLDEEAQQSLVMDTFIPKAHWAYAGDENVTIYPYDPDKGKELLDEAGWVVDDGTGVRFNEAGEELTLKFTLTSAQYRQTYAAVWEQQMADCGIQILRFHVPASWLYGDTTGQARRDYEVAAWAWVGQMDPGGRDLHACDQIPYPENGWAGQNTDGWCNEVATKAIVKAVNTLERAERIEAYKIVQQEYTKDVPVVPLFNHTETFAVTANMQGFNPLPGEEYYTYNIDEWEIPGKDTIVLGFTQEPASLFGLVESSFAATLAESLIQGFMYSTQNYDANPLMMAELSTLDSGLAVNNIVEVKEGDTVFDVTGASIELTSGVKVMDATGQEVEFTGDPIQMLQMTVTVKLIPNLKFSDGTPVTAEDIQLRHTIDCDPTSGAVSYINCNRITDFVAADDGYTINFVPGVQDPVYYTTFFNDRLGNWYPAHLTTEDGRTLAEIPAAEWATLPELAEYPIGVGPYVLKEWVKGEKMVFEANPYYWGGEPKTKNIVIMLITAENAEAQLLSGQVDILDSTTLVGVTETLKNAADAGEIDLYVVPGGTWEHIDFNMWLP